MGLLKKERAFSPKTMLKIPGGKAWLTENNAPLTSQSKKKYNSSLK